MEAGDPGVSLDLLVQVLLAAGARNGISRWRSHHGRRPSPPNALPKAFAPSGAKDDPTDAEVILWAKALYESCRARGARHQAALRALAFKWIRVLHRCWLDRVPYYESRYLMALQKRGAPLLKHAARNAT
jgi:hypothetical protein